MCPGHHGSVFIESVEVKAGLLASETWHVSPQQFQGRSCPVAADVSMGSKDLAYSGALLSAGDPHRPGRGDRGGVSPAAMEEAAAVLKVSKSSWGSPQGPGTPSCLPGKVKPGGV